MKKIFLFSAISIMSLALFGCENETSSSTDSTSQAIVENSIQNDYEDMDESYVTEEVIQTKTYECSDEIANANITDPVFQIGDKIYRYDEPLTLGELAADWTCYFYTGNQMSNTEIQEIANKYFHTGVYLPVDKANNNETELTLETEHFKQISPFWMYIEETGDYLSIYLWSPDSANSWDPLSEQYILEIHGINTHNFWLSGGLNCDMTFTEMKQHTLTEDEDWTIQNEDAHISYCSEEEQPRSLCLYSNVRYDQTNMLSIRWSMTKLKELFNDSTTESEPYEVPNIEIKIDSSENE